MTPALWSCRRPCISFPGLVGEQSWGEGAEDPDKGLPRFSINLPQEGSPCIQADGTLLRSGPPYMYSPVLCRCHTSQYCWSLRVPPPAWCYQRDPEKRRKVTKRPLQDITSISCISSVVWWILDGSWGVRRFRYI